MSEEQSNPPVSRWPSRAEAWQAVTWALGVGVPLTALLTYLALHWPLHWILLAPVLLFVSLPLGTSALRKRQWAAFGASNGFLIACVSSLFLYLSSVPPSP